MRVFIHDYLIDYLGGPETGDVYCNVTLYYSSHSEMDDDEWPLPRLGIDAGTPDGITDYLKRVMNGKIYDPPFLMPSCIIMAEFDIKELLKHLRERISKIQAGNEKELMIKLSQHFSLDEDYFRTDDLYRHLLYEKNGK